MKQVKFTISGKELLNCDLENESLVCVTLRDRYGSMEFTTKQKEDIGWFIDPEYAYSAVIYYIDSEEYKNYYTLELEGRVI